MKTIIRVFAVALSFTMAFAASAQQEGRIYLPSTQAVMNALVDNPNAMIITGKIFDKTTKHIITDAKISFDKFGEELINASIDKNGNYALAIDKSAIGDIFKVIFKVEGYQKYVAKSINKAMSVVDLDLFLSPDGKQDKSSADIKYKMSDDTFSKLVIQLQ